MIAVTSTRSGNEETARFAALPELAGWSPTVVETPAAIDARTAAMIAAMLNQDAPQNGDALPPGWHWAYFLTPVPQRDLGEDGHPKKGGFLPPISLPRRMFAGSKITFHRPITIGGNYLRRDEVLSVKAKDGRSGRLVFVKVRNAIEDERGNLALDEEQDIVYRPAAAAAGTSAAPAAESQPWQWRQSVIADPVMLFRFSSVTFNGHRIHYDHPYATGVEGYPGLVVHGTLLATLMLELARKEGGSAGLSSFSFAGKQPVFASEAFAVVGNPESDGRSARLAVLNKDNVEAMTGQAGFRPVQ